jgi:hypothetical protein
MIRVYRYGGRNGANSLKSAHIITYFTKNKVQKVPQQVGCWFSNFLFCPIFFAHFKSL